MLKRKMYNFFIFLIAFMTKVDNMFNTTAIENFYGLKEHVRNEITTQPHRILVRH